MVSDMTLCDATRAEDAGGSESTGRTTGRHRPVGELARRAPPCAVNLLALLFAVTAARAQQPVFVLEGEFYPESRVAESLAGPVTEAEVGVVRVTLGPLFAIGDRPTLLVPSLSGTLVDISASPSDPAGDEPIDRLYDLDLRLTVVRFLSPRWVLAVTASPGIASDFEDIDGSHLTFQGSAVVTKVVRPTLSWSVGAAVTNAFGEILPVPILGLQWQGPSYRADVLAPDRGEFVFTPGDVIEIGVSADVDGNIYTLGRDDELKHAVVRYSVINIGPLVNVKLATWARLSLAGGASLNRRLEIEDEAGDRIQDVELENGAYLRAGLSLYPSSRG